MKKSKINLLLTGCSGFIGTNVVEWLIENNFQFINIDIISPKNENHKLNWRKVDITDFDSLQKEIIKFNPTHILHLAAALGMERSNISELDANTVGVENIIKVVKEIKTVKRIVFTSSLLVCKNGYIPENDTDYCPPNLYGKSKVLGEEKVRSARLNCEWVIVRPTSIWGPWFDYSYRDFFISIDKNRYMHIGKNEFQKPTSFVGNTVHMLMKILLEVDPEVNKSTYYLADYPWYSTKEWANTIQKTLNSKSIKTAPLWILRFVAIVGDLIKKIFKFDSPLTSFRLDNMLTGGEYPVDNTKLVVGKLPYDLNESVYLTAQWMYENDLIKHKPIKI